MTALNCILTIGCIFCLSLSVIEYAESKRIHSFMGPFKVNVKRVTKCQERVADGVDYYVRDARTSHGQNPCLSGNVTLRFPINDSIEIHAMLASWSAMGGWKENAYIIKLKEACKTMNSIFGVMWEPFEMNIFGQTNTCPLLPGIYRFVNATVEQLKFPSKMFVYGRWRGDLMYSYRGHVPFCMRCFIDTEPM